MAKITKKYIDAARADLARVNGRRHERIISEEELLQLIAATEKKYQENAREKYFQGVEARAVGAAYDKPAAYQYRAEMTAVYISLYKGRPPVIRVTRDPWGYISRDTAYRPRVIWG